MIEEVIILGKPNVGKSSLFNAIVEKKIALVKNFSGLTRDLRKKEVNFLGKKYILIDSAGISNEIDKFNKNIMSNTKDSIEKCRLILFVVEGNNPLTFEDYEIIKLIRKFNKKKILVINKCESKLSESIDFDVNRTGIGSQIYVSAEHKIGILDLKTEINSQLSNKTNNLINYDIDHSVAIVGKPNTGKSTLLNNLIGKKVSITGSMPHLTRDPVETRLLWEKVNFKIFDTAGIVNQSKKIRKIDLMSIHETKRKIRLSEIIILVLDINDYFEKLNFKLMRLIVDESRCLIIVINKIDSLAFFSENYIKKSIYSSFPQIKNVPIFFTSALNNLGLKKLMNGIIKFIPKWEKRISTNKLNNWLRDISKRNTPSLHNGREVKLKFLTQVNIKPPKFVLFSNFPNAIRDSYRRYLINNLKKDFMLQGVVVSIDIVKSKNPYE